MKNILVTLIILNLILVSTTLSGQKKTIRLDSARQVTPYVNKYLIPDGQKGDTAYYIRRFTYGYKDSDTTIKKQYGIVENPKFIGSYKYLDSINNKFRFKVNDLKFTTDKTSFSLSQTIDLVDTSGPKNLIIDVDKETLELLLKIQCDLESGIVEVEILDPEGSIQGSFSVDSQMKKTDSGWGKQVEGSIDKRIINPETGEWTIVFKTKKATGVIKVNTTIIN